MINLTQENFKTEVLDSDKPVLVDFYSYSCGPCKVVEPFLKNMEEKYEGIKFSKIEAGESMEVFGEYGVGRVPTLVLFKNGKEVERKGFLVGNELVEWLDGV